MTHRVLLTGATGYVGGRLIEPLVAAGHAVRCLARRPEALARLPAGCEVVAGDVLDRSSVTAAARECGLAFYLVHSMGSSSGFEERDRAAAIAFAEGCRDAGVRRIVYLGGLADETEDLSPHLRSRHEVGRLLRERVPTIEVRASVIIGSGSLSFEMVRALVERLPIMITPRWVDVLAQPVAIDDVLAWLVQAMDVPGEGSRIVEIGGADVVSYCDIMREYAKQRGLRRVFVRVPVLTPALSALWLGLVTPLYARVGRKLIDSVRHDTIVRAPPPVDLFRVQPRGIAESIRLALRNEDRAIAATRWSDALSSGSEPRDWSGVPLGSRLIDSRTVRIAAPPATAFAPVRRIGGRTGWYGADWLWRARGALDLVVGGVGMRRGRRHPGALSVGDALDFWRVEAHEPDRLLRLSAEMRLPGRAWLEFEVTPDGDGSILRQTAIFDPLGLAGRLYWHALRPLHAVVFGSMLRGIARAALAEPEPG